MTHTDGVALYNPGRLKEQDFLDRFVARTDLAAFLLDQLRATAKDVVGKHHLLVGVRGMGKSTLLRRIAIGVSRDPSLAERYAALTFREEQYNVISLDAFWRNCGEALAEWCDAKGESEQAKRLDKLVASPEWRDPELAAAGFLSACKGLPRRPILLVDNLDLILDALSEQESRALRRILRAPGGPILYGAATRLLRGVGDLKEVFHGFFGVHSLEPLTEHEVVRCMLAYADSRGAAGAPVRTIVAREPERLRTLHELTGGNPRVLALIYRLLEGGESRTVIEDLDVLLDQVSPYYKARIEEYQTALQKAVIDAVALNWNPIGSREIGQVMGTAVTTISSQLDRFKKDGLIEEVETSGARAGYQLAERFFNIWYLMRHGTRGTKQKVRWLTEFLRAFYAPEELRRMRVAADDPAERERWHPLHREALFAAVEGLEAVERNLAGAIQATSGRSGLLQAESKSTIANTLLNEAWKLGEQGRLDEQIVIYDELISRFVNIQEPEFQAMVAVVFLNRGVARSKLDRNEEAIADFDEVTLRLADAPGAELQETVANALYNKGVVLGQLDEREEAIAAYDEVVNRFADAADLMLQEHVAKALVNKGAKLGHMGRNAEAITVYDDVVRRFTDAPNLTLREQVAMALINKGARLGQLGQREEAITVYGDVARRFADAPDLELREKVARALFNKGVMLGQLGRSEAAIAAYDSVFFGFADAPDVALRKWVAKALFNKGVTLGVLGRIQDAIRTYGDVIRSLAGASDLELRELVAWAILGKGIALGQLGQSEDEIAAYDEMALRFADAPGLARVQQAWAVFNKGVKLGQFARTEEAITTFDDLTLRFADASDQELLETIARALGNKGNILADLAGRIDEAEAVYREAIARSSEPAIPTANLAWLLLASDRLDEAIALRSGLDDLHAVGQSLLDAGLELARDNFGAAVEHLLQALTGDQTALATIFADDLYRLLRLAETRGYGEKLIDWFEASGHADRQAPIYAAFVAYVRGERFLRDVNPEVRRPAEKIYAWLSSRRRAQQAVVEQPAKPARRRVGRPPKRRGPT